MPLETLLLLGGALLAAGAGAGFIAGLLGVGGGIIIVPVLFQVFGLFDVPDAVRMHAAVGTSLSTIIATSLSSMRSHHRRGSVDWSLLRSWAPWVAVGVVAGAALAAVVSGPVLTGVFASGVLVIAGYLALAPEGLRLASSPPRGVVRAGVGGTIGCVASMMGIGGGTLSVPTMVLCGYPVRLAVGTSSAIGMIIATFGTAGFAVAGWGAEGVPPGSIGYVNLLAFAILVPMTVSFAPLGARVAHKIAPRILRIAFAAFLLLTATSMWLSVLGIA